MASPGMDQRRLADLQDAIRADIKAGWFHGAVIKVALETAIGAADAAQTHQAGFPIIFDLTPGWYIDRFEEISAAVVAEVKPVDEPCAKVSYSPQVNHVLLAEALLLH